MPELILQAVREYRLWQPGAGRVVVGVSGGADSVALLAGLTELPRAWRPELYAASLDHGLRRNAGAEVLAVARLAAALGVPFENGVADVAAAARAGGRGIEAAARAARYAFLSEVAHRLGAETVAVGHHRDDQVETVLLRLLRGAGSRGLSGMRPKRLLSGPGSFRGWLVRPLWLAGRAEVLTYLRARGLTWTHDESNDDTGLPRNRIRHHLVPDIERAFGSGVRRTLARAADHLSEEDEALSLWADHVTKDRSVGEGLDVGHGFEVVPSAVRARVLQAWWEAATGLPPLAACHLKRLDQVADGRRIDLPQGFQARRDRDVLTMRRTPLPPAGFVDLPVPGSVRVPGVGGIRAEVTTWPNPEISARLRADPLVAGGDLASVALPLRLRPPEPGERLLALGAPGPRPVRELLRDCGIPPMVRKLPIVVADAASQVLWLAGARQAEAFRLEEGTRRVLVLTLEMASSVFLGGSRSLS